MSTSPRSSIVDLPFRSLQYQIDYVRGILSSDSLFMDILRTDTAKKYSAYLGSGCVTQRIWNALTGRDAMYGIDDHDIVYYDEKDISKEAQDQVQASFERQFPSVNIECTNQARVHLWYESFCGVAIDQFKSVEEAIDIWPTTASAVGVYLQDNVLHIYAPRGLHDMLGLIVRPNKGIITRETYEKKVKKWIARWPELSVVPW